MIVSFSFLLFMLSQSIYCKFTYPLILIHWFSAWVNHSFRVCLYHHHGKYFHYFTFFLFCLISLKCWHKSLDSYFSVVLYIHLYHAFADIYARLNPLWQIMKPWRTLPTEAKNSIQNIERERGIEKLIKRKWKAKTYTHKKTIKNKKNRKNNDEFIK